MINTSLALSIRETWKQERLQEMPSCFKELLLEDITMTCNSRLSGNQSFSQPIKVYPKCFCRTVAGWSYNGCCHDALRIKAQLKNHDSICIRSCFKIYHQTAVPLRNVPISLKQEILIHGRRCHYSKCCYWYGPCCHSNYDTYHVTTHDKG